MKKRIIIISSILIVLFAAGFITIQIIYGTINYFSKTVESSFNLSLKNIKKKSEDFKLTYNDFKCSGKRSIECFIMLLRECGFNGYLVGVIFISSPSTNLRY